MFKSKQRARNQRLAELITEIAGSIGRFDKNLFRGLVQPLAHWQDVFPTASTMKTGIAGHVNSCSSDRPRADTTTHSVTNLTTSTGGGSIERFYRRREIMSLRLDGNDAFYVFNNEIIACGLVLWGKLLDYRALFKSYIVFVCRKDVMGILLSGFLNHGKETAGPFPAINDECSPEYLMAAMLRVDLSKAKDFGIG